MKYIKHYKTISDIKESNEEEQLRNWREKFEEIRDYFIEFQDDEIIDSYNIGFGTKSQGVWIHHDSIRLNRGKNTIESADTDGVGSKTMDLYCNSKKYVFSLYIEFRIPSIYKDDRTTCITPESGNILANILLQCNRIPKDEWLTYIEISGNHPSYKPLRISFIEKDDTLKRI